MMLEQAQGDRIVVIEDEAAHRMVLETWLRFEGYDVVCARSAEEGLELIWEQRPALVMLDLVLPGMSGFELLERKAIDPALMDVGVIIISSLEGDRERLAGLRLGAFDFLPKPFQPMELSARVRNYVERDRITQALALQARTDSLTGLYTRRAFEQAYDEALRQARRYGVPMSVVAVDIDHFKEVNDDHGHAAGDEVLRRVSELLRATVREADIVARFGGEEFVVVLPHTDCAGAAVLAEKLRASVEAERVEAIGRNCTVSLGVVSWDPGAGEAGDLLARADVLLYEAKASGRNRVVAG
jgi:diguanylate cyclase (GGDEF)-like protein